MTWDLPSVMGKRGCTGHLEGGGEGKAGRRDRVCLEAREEGGTASVCCTLRAQCQEVLLH